MSEERRNPQNTESDESGLLLSVDPMSDRSPDSAALGDDADSVDADPADTDGEDIAADADGTDATDADATDDADGTD